MDLARPDESILARLDPDDDRNRALEMLRLQLPAGGAVDAAATRDREFLRSLVHCQEVGRATATEGDFAVRQRERRRLARAV